MVECERPQLAQSCPCTYTPCERKGKCCECITYHRTRGQLPGCLFPPEAEKTYDRSIAAYVRAIYPDKDA